MYLMMNFQFMKTKTRKREQCIILLQLERNQENKNEVVRLEIVSNRFIFRKSQKHYQELRPLTTGEGKQTVSFVYYHLPGPPNWLLARVVGPFFPFETGGSNI